MLHSLGRRAICVLLILACSIQVQSEPIHRRPFHQERDSYDDRTVAAAFHALSFKFWNSVSERSVDIKHDLGVPPQNDPRYQLIKRQGGSGAVTKFHPICDSDYSAAILFPGDNLRCIHTSSQFGNSVHRDSRHFIPPGDLPVPNHPDPDDRFAHFGN
uniref:Uncharacterized protein n=1 Tax=Coccidioides posadasii RMSCC 3488 TaxID=454284 RepID=A0A0J6FAS4_COCPO|nr:hypothetical protein CPAG_02694 [Coccidioides posadasii RMSCC 3488]